MIVDTYHTKPGSVGASLFPIPEPRRWGPQIPPHVFCRTSRAETAISQVKWRHRNWAVCFFTKRFSLGSNTMYLKSSSDGILCCIAVLCSWTELSLHFTFLNIPFWCTSIVQRHIATNHSSKQWPWYHCDSNTRVYMKIEKFTVVEQNKGQKSSDDSAVPCKTKIQKLQLLFPLTP